MVADMVTKRANDILWMNILNLFVDLGSYLFPLLLLVVEEESLLNKQLLWTSKESYN